jgi:hypothetical protein
MVIQRHSIRSERMTPGTKGLCPVVGMAVTSSALRPAALRSKPVRQVRV